MNTPNFADSIADLIRELGGEMLQHTAVVVGSTAIYLASPATARLPHDLDLSIPEDIYQRFRLFRHGKAPRPPTELKIFFVTINAISA